MSVTLYILRLWVCIAFGLLACNAGAQLQEQWLKTVTNALDRAMTPSGDLIAVTADSVLKIDTAGEVRWRVPSTNECFQSVAVDGAGNIFVALYRSAERTMFLVRFDAEGQGVWRTGGNYLIDGLSAGGLQVACSEAGETVVAYTDSLPWEPSRYAVIKFDLNGARLWGKNVPGSLRYGKQLRFDREGNLIIAGSPGVYKLSPEGDLLWTYNEPYSLDDLTVGSDGSVFWASGSLMLTKLTSDGQLAWQKTNVSSVLRAEPDGGVLVGERRAAFPARTAATLTRLAAAGNTLWRTPLPGDPMAFVTNSAGNYVGMAITNGYWGQPYKLVEVTGDGEQVWIETYINAYQSFVLWDGFLIAPDGSYRLFGAGWNRQQVIASLVPAPVPGLPRITKDPDSTNVLAGHGATFAVEATGDGPLTYQWVLGNTALVGQTGATMTIATTWPGDSGDVFVEVSNAKGRVRSRVAELGVFYAMQSAEESYDVSVALNGTIELRRLLYGTGPLTYQWYHDGALLAGHTNETLRIPAAQLHHAGQYIQEVRNPVSVALSAWQVVVNPSVAREWSRSQVSTQCCAGLQVISAEDGIYTTGNHGIRKYYPDGQLRTMGDPATAIASVPGGGIIAAETVRSGPYDYHKLTRYTTEGSRLWENFLSAPALSLYIISNHVVASGLQLAFYKLDGSHLSSHSSGVLKVVPAPDDTLVAVGLITSSSGFQLASYRTTADGQPIGGFSLGFLSLGFDTAITTEGDLIIATDRLTARYDRLGNRKWRVTNEVSGYVGHTKLALDALGGPLVYLGSDLVKYDSNGVKQWRRTSRRIGFQAQTLVDLKANAAGELYLLGGAPNQHEVLEKIDPNGNTIWAASVGQLGVHRASTTGAVTFGPAGNVIVAVANGETETVMSFVESGAPGPVITSSPQPENTSTVIGSTVVLSATASGAEPISYQWFRDSLSEPTGTNAQLVIQNAHAVQSGWYFLQVSNAHGFVFTRAVNVLIGPAPEFELWDGGRLQATSFARVNEGGSVRLQTRPQDYGGSFATPQGWQWSFNGNVIPGATNTFLVISNASLAHAGVYTLSASNVYAAANRSITLVVESAVQTIFSKRKRAWPHGYHWLDPRAPYLAANSASQLYFLAGHPDNAGWFLAKYRQNGTAIWNKTFGPAAAPAGMALDAAQNVIVAGTTNHWLKGVPVVVKYDPDANMLWQKRIPAARGSRRFTTGFAQNGAGELFLTGSDDGVAPAGIFVTKLTPNGVQAWGKFQAVNPATEHVVHAALAPTPGGGVYVASALGLTRFNAAGQRLWLRGSNFVAAAVAPDGSVYATGSPGLSKYSVSGDLLWTFPLSSARIEVDSRGVVVFHSEITLRLDEQGNEMWAVMGGGAGALDALGRAYVSSMNGSLVSRALNVQGQEIWQAVSDASGSFFASGGADVVVCPNGDVVVAHQNEDHYVIERYRPDVSAAPSPVTLTLNVQGPVRPGTPVCFVASGIGAQDRVAWFRYGGEIPGATNRTLCVTADWDTDGSYEVAAVGAQRVFASSHVLLRLQRPFLYAPVKDANNQIHLRLLPPFTYGSYRIETSSDLKTWTSVTNVIGGGQMPLSVVLRNSRAPAEFFRAVQE